MGRLSNASRLTALPAVLMAMLFALPVFAQSLKDVTAELCVSGDCVDGRGRLEFTTPFGKGEYAGNFSEGEFHGIGRLDMPLSFTEREVYDGNWRRGLRDGRGKHWNGRGNLYIGEWMNNKRHGRGSYFINLPEWRENEHSEFWLSENTENYRGEFQNDNYHGRGTYRWPNGNKFEGSFFANNKHGQGTFYYAAGTARQQLWNYGDFVR